MKNLSRFILISLFITSFFSSCEKQNNGIWDITLSVEADGDLEAWSSICYYDKEGQLQTETLTPNWSTTFELNSADAELIVRAKGAITGDLIKVKYETTLRGVGPSQSGERIVYTEDLNQFDILIEEKLLIE